MLLPVLGQSISPYWNFQWPDVHFSRFRWNDGHQWGNPVRGMNQFNSYLWMLLMPMLMLGGMVDLINRTIVSGERIFSILDREPEIKNPENPVVLKEIKGK